MKDVRVHAVVVTYFPEVSVLRELIMAIVGQVDRIHIVDNTHLDDTRLEQFMQSGIPAGVSLQRLGGNLGIAKALNVGIEAALAEGSTHLLFSDQDSLPSEEMVTGLVAVLADLDSRGRKVAAIGPVFMDENTGAVRPFQVEKPGRFFYGHTLPDAMMPTVEAITLITSGMLVPASALRDVGLMREDFFIDSVDNEWCHRARSHGWRLYGTTKGAMRHRMGEQDSLRVWYFGWRVESAYPPIRMYYCVRNFIALSRLDYIQVRWKIRNAWYMAGFVYSQTVFGRRKLESLRMAFRGLVDGLSKRMGAYKDV
ncbi:glycosyltransferase family 2 protein [Solilutibacter silvestris]|uniref:glycosyltransferase family 2 protein n=1 Tax=Solilutibacter silvestris TaxID=1645665 RepID=UPI003D33785A